MSLPDQTPKLPKLPFLIGDAALLATAWFIASRGHGALGGEAIAAVTACVAVGALLGVIPFLSDYARKQDEALDERQRGLEALARTVNTAAEQISIAANGLHEITELAHKNLKHAEQLPHKLQEKIAEFNAQLDNAREDDREELEKELVELRASESERLAAVADKIHKSVAELAKLDTAAQKHLAARAELVGSATDTIAKTDAVAALDASLVAITRELAAAQTKALAEIDATLAARTTAAIAAIEAASRAMASPAIASIPDTPAPEPAATDATATPKRPRKPRHEEPAAETPAALASAPAPLETSAPAALPAEPSPAEAVPDAVAEPAIATEPPPIPVEAIAKIEPVVPSSATPFPAEAAVAESPGVPPAVVPVPAVEPPPPADRPAKKRAAKKTAAPAADLPLGLAGDEFSSATGDDTPITTAEVVERVISSDGATRLIVTAYIGIGNRLFIRGDGPGLSWEKGVPLQFVSIGKWRWETADATAPVKFKLYKNDEFECAALGALALDPGYQQEVTAKF